MKDLGAGGCFLAIVMWVALLALIVLGNLGMYHAGVWAIEQVYPTWKCPNYWGGFVLFQIALMLVGWLGMLLRGGKS